MADKLVVSTTTAQLPGGETVRLKTQTSYTVGTNGALIPGKVEVYRGTLSRASVRSEAQPVYTLAATANTAGDGLYKGGFTKVENSPLSDAEFRSLNTKDGVFNRSVRQGIAGAAITKGENEPGLSVGQAQALIGAPQTLPNAPAPDPQSGTNPGTATTVTYTQEQAIAAIESKDVRIKYENLSYPEKRNKNQDYIKFEMLEYAPRKFNAPSIQAFSSGNVDAGLAQEIFGSRKDRNAIGTVTLPISSPISDTNTVNWNDDSIGALNAFGQGAFAGLLGTAQSENPPPPPTSGQGGNAATKALVVSELSKAAVGGNNNILTRTTGAIVNPNLELLFNGPNLRTFSFTFPLSARGPNEAKIILKIIRFFKQGMSVKRSTSSLFLKSPHTFRIKYIYAKNEENHIEHPWINKIKECALTNCTVNYTPAGNYATYRDGTMTMYEITLNFSELEPVFDDEYGNKEGNPSKDTNVGY